MQDIDSVPSNVQSSRQEALLYVFEDNEAVSKMVIKGRSPTMRHVSRTHRVALDWLFDRLIWIPRFKLGTPTPNINSQTYRQKVISQVMSGTIFFICSTSAISAPLAAFRISA